MKHLGKNIARRSSVAAVIMAFHMSTEDYVQVTKLVESDYKLIECLLCTELLIFWWKAKSLNLWSKLKVTCP